MTLILDAGAFVAIERGDRRVVAAINRQRLRGQAPVTHGAVVAQVWRGGAGLQARLARALRGVEVVPVDDQLGKRAGVLLARAGMRDAIDSALVCLAEDDDTILTSDLGDLQSLAEAANRRIDIVAVSSVSGL